MLELDHVVIAAADLEAAAVVLEERYGPSSFVVDPRGHLDDAQTPSLARRL